MQQQNRKGPHTDTGLNKSPIQLLRGRRSARSPGCCCAGKSLSTIMRQGATFTQAVASRRATLSPSGHYLCEVLRQYQ